MRGSLRAEVPKYQLLKQRLLANYPDLDEEAQADTLEGITDLHEMIAAVIRSALVDEALHAGLRFRVEDMRERLSRLELRAAKKRQLALEAMTEVGLNKLEQPDFTASARAGSPSLVVIAEDAIPKLYWVPQPPKLDRQSLLGRAEAGRRGSWDPTWQSATNPFGEDEVMAFTEAQVKQLESEARVPSRSRPAKPTASPSPMSRAGTSSPRQTVFSATMPGIGGRGPPIASGPEPKASFTTPPIRRRCA